MSLERTKRNPEKQTERDCDEQTNTKAQREKTSTRLPPPEQRALLSYR
jgi:hypothetical protein